MTARSWVLLLVLFLCGLFGISSVKAACYCQDPTAGNCRCTGAPPASAKNEASVGGIAVICDTPAEANSIFATKAPICGSSPEIVPACAPNKALASEYTCYGAQFAVGAANIPPEAFSSLTRVDGIQFNGVSYPNARSVLACNSIAFCCARSDIECDDTAVPSTPSSCTPQDRNITPPASICGVVGGSENPVGQSDTDARIYFPHVKNTSSLTYLLQSMFRPVSWTIDQIKDNVVYSKLFEHQGIDDNTPVINKTDNNSALIPGTAAPTPLFDFGSTTPQGTIDNGQCLMTNVRSNPGDDLLGNKIYADLEYSQVYQYELLPGVLEGTCRTSHQRADSSGQCCSGEGTGGEDLNGDGDADYVTCNEANDNLPSKGKVLVYTKSPFLEYLYQNLVAGPAGIYRRFVSQDTAKLIEDNPTKATIAVDSNPGKVTVADGATQPTSDIYFPHVGSIYDNFLKNLQKLLRPLGIGSTLPPGTSTQPGSAGCNTPLTSCGPMNWNDPFLDVYYNAYNSDNNSSWTLVKEPWAQAMIDSSGMCGKFVTTLWIEETGGSAIGSYDLGCIYNLKTKAKSQANTHPTTLSASELQRYRQTILAEQLTCLKSYVDAIGDNLQTFMCQYSGEADTDPNTPYRQCTNFTNNPNFPVNFCSILNGSAPGGAGPAPQNIDQPTDQAGIDTSSYIVSGTPSQICSSVGFGIRQQQGTTNCVECANGNFYRQFRCPGPMYNRNFCQGKANAVYQIPDYNSIPDPDNQQPGPYPDNSCVQCQNGNVLRSEIITPAQGGCFVLQQRDYTCRGLTGPVMATNSVTNQRVCCSNSQAVDDSICQRQ